MVGGVGIQFQTHGNVTLAPIRSGIGLRLGANVGYFKYTRVPNVEPVLSRPRDAREATSGDARNARVAHATCAVG